jgi:hypothetical protein
MIILPRQARDKHREKLKTEYSVTVFLQVVAALESLGVLPPPTAWIRILFPQAAAAPVAAPAAAAATQAAPAVSAAATEVGEIPDIEDCWRLHEAAVAAGEQSYDDPETVRTRLLFALLDTEH